MKTGHSQIIRVFITKSSRFLIPRYQPSGCVCWLPRPFPIIGTLSTSVSSLTQTRSSSSPVQDLIFVPLDGPLMAGVETKSIIIFGMVFMLPSSVCVTLELSWSLRFRALSLTRKSFTRHLPRNQDGQQYDRRSCDDIIKDMPLCSLAMVEAFSCFQLIYRS